MTLSFGLFIGRSVGFQAIDDSLRIKFLSWLIRFLLWNKNAEIIKKKL